MSLTVSALFSVLILPRTAAAPPTQEHGEDLPLDRCGREPFGSPVSGGGHCRRRRAVFIRRHHWCQAYLDYSNQLGVFVTQIAYGAVGVVTAVASTL